MVALTCWISKGIPSIIVGVESGDPGGLEVIVIAEVIGFSSISQAWHQAGRGPIR